MDHEPDTSQSGYDCDSPLPTRNPSPPPELRDNEEAMADIIKGTMISKEWIFSIFLKLIEEVQKPTEPEQGVEVSEFGVDVDDDLQTELCLLQDMAMTAEVAKFLLEYKAVSILAKVINESKAPRINEICVGILANMCCVPELCEEMAKNEMFVSLVSALLSNTEFDPLTLKETMRLLHTSLCNEAVSEMWVKVIRENPYVKQLIIFCFESSTNNELLKCTGDAVDVLLDVSDDLCQDWASPELVLAMLEAVQQIGHSRSDDLKPFLHAFQLLSTSQPGVQALVGNGESVVDQLLRYLRCVCDDEIVGIEDHLACLCSVVSILHLLFTSDSALAESLSSKPSFFEHMLKVLEGLYRASRDYGNVVALPACFLTSRQDSTDLQSAEIHRPSGNQPHSQEASVTDGKQADGAVEGHVTSDQRRSNGGMKGQQQQQQEGYETHAAQQQQGDETHAAQHHRDSEARTAQQQDRGDGQPAAQQHHDGETHAAQQPRRGETTQAAAEGKETQSGGDEESVYIRDEQHMRMLFELLQNFFRDFINSLQMEEAPGESSPSEAKKKALASTNPPLFKPALQYLDRGSPQHVSYLVHTLVHNIPISASGDHLVRQGDGSGKDLSEKGWSSLENLCSLCETLNLKRAAQLLTDSMRAIR